MDVGMELDTTTEDVSERNNNMENKILVNQKNENGEHLKKDRILKIPKKRERTNDNIDVKAQEEDDKKYEKRKKMESDTGNKELNVKEKQACEDFDGIQVKTNVDIRSDKEESMQQELLTKGENEDQKNMEEKQSIEGSKKQTFIKNQKVLLQDKENQCENNEKQATEDENQACDNEEKTLNQERDYMGNVCTKQLYEADGNQVFENLGTPPLTHEATKIQKDKDDKNEILEENPAVNKEELQIYARDKGKTSVENRKVFDDIEKCDNEKKHVLEIEKKEQICETKETVSCKGDKNQLSKEETKSKDNIKHTYSDREKHACLVKEKRIIRRFKDYNCKQMWSEKFQDQMAYVNCIITDIEGTTTSISFVKDVIYKYIDNVFPAYIKEHWDDEELANDVKDIIELSKEYEAENIPGYVPIPERKLNSTPEEEAKFQMAFLANYNWQMENRPKSRYMKKLQGHLVADGYRNHEVVGHVYDDVKVAFKLWKKNKVKVCTFSNGSIYAQHLLFHYSRCGNMEDYIDVYFDTTIGEKIDPSSYSFICSAIKENAEDVLFLTDLLAEACAAKKAGLKVLLVQRETTVLSDDDKQLLCHTDGIISSFSELICPPDP